MLPMRALRYVLLILVATCCLMIANRSYAQKVLRWKLRPGEVLNYQMVQEIKQNLVPGKDAPPMHFTTTQIMDMRWVVESVDDAGVISVEQKVERIQMKMQSPQGINLKYDSQAGKPPEGLALMVAPVFNALINKPIPVKYTPQGEIKEMKVAEDLLNKINQVAGAGQAGNLITEDWMKQMGNLGLLPTGPVQPNQTWRNTETIEAPFLGKMTVVTTFCYRGVEVRDEKPLEKVTMSIQFKSDGKQKKGIVGIREQSGDGTTYFDAEAGRVRESQSRMKMKMTIEILGRKMNQDMDLNTVTKLVSEDTVELPSGESSQP